MSTKGKTATAKKGKAVSKFTPKFNPDTTINLMDRGKEFIAMKKGGMSQQEIVKFYASKGIELSIPAYYNAVRLANAPKYVHDAIQAGEVKATSVLPLLIRKGSKNEKDFEARLRAGLTKLVEDRKARRTMLKKGGFTGANGKGATKLTKARTVSLVGQSLEKIRKSGALKDAGAKAVLEFINGIKENKTSEELVKALLNK